MILWGLASGTATYVDVGAVPVRFEETGRVSTGRISTDREAVAFTAMGYEARHGRPNPPPAATGARRAVPSGRLAFPPNGPGPAFGGRNDGR